MYAAATERLNLTEEAERRASVLQENGLKPFDSLHLALAETSGANVFLTTDDRLLNAARRIDLRL